MPNGSQTEPQNGAKPDPRATKIVSRTGLVLGPRPGSENGAFWSIFGFGFGAFLDLFRPPRGFLRRNADFQKTFKHLRIFNIFEMVSALFLNSFHQTRVPGTGLRRGRLLDLFLDLFCTKKGPKMNAKSTPEGAREHHKSVQNSDPKKDRKWNENGRRNRPQNQVN